MSLKPKKQPEIQFLDRVVTFSSLGQSLTYRGSEGLPTVERNQEMIKCILEGLHSSQVGRPIYLVPPLEEPLEYMGAEPYEFGTPATLPAVLCIGGLTSSDETTNGDGEWSALTLVWFQDTFALPIDARVRRHLKKTDWNRYAASYDY
jgi:hypothetical protein